jgi:hypothetical protein
MSASSSLKQININPELFKVKSNRTRKNGAKPENKVASNELPASVRNKLLTRIKERKNAEHSQISASSLVQPQGNSFASSSSSSNQGTRGALPRRRIRPNTSRIHHIKPPNSGDEFDDSLSYFKQLDNSIALQRKTVKNYSTPPPMVNIELPAELMPQQQVFVKNDAPSQPISLRYNVDNNVPYGCLKGGVKPTYKHLYTRRAPMAPNPPPRAPVSFSTPSSFNNETNERQQKLAYYQQQQQQQMKPQPLVQSQPIVQRPAQQIQQPQSHSLVQSQPLIQRPITQAPPQIKPPPVPLEPDYLPASLAEVVPELKEMLEPEPKQKNAYTAESLGKVLSSAPDENYEKEKELESARQLLAQNKKKQKVHKTIKRKYTIGRNLKTNTVGVLIKDNYTRKMVVNAHKELKKKSLNDLKKELRGNNLIKPGSIAPNDLLRATYENAKLAGDIVNTNAGMLLHNFVHNE